MENSTDISVPLTPKTDFKRLIFPEYMEEPKHCLNREFIGSLLYLSICASADILLVVLRLARFVSNPIESHWNVLTNLLKYVKGTKTCGLFFPRKRSVT